MQAVDVMQTRLAVTSPTDTVEAAARLMLDHRVSGLPVVDDKGRLIGMITEGDLLHRVENDTDKARSLLSRAFSSPARLRAEFVKATGRRVNDVMTKHVVTATETTLLADIADLLDRNRIKRVPVLRDGKLVGIVTRADLLRAMVTAGSRGGELRVVDFR